MHLFRKSFMLVAVLAIFCIMAAPLFAQVATPKAAAAPAAAPAETAAAESSTAFGIRGDLGFSGGLSSQWYGRNLENDNSYQSTSGSGFAWDIEGLWDATENIEIGLGIFAPLGVDKEQTSKHTSITNQNWGGPVVVTESDTDTTTPKFGALPIIANIYLRTPITSELKLFTGMGLGFAMGGDFVADSKGTSTGSGVDAAGTVQGTFSGTSTGKSTSTIGSALAYRGAVGMEYKMSSSFSLFGTLSFIFANLPMTKTVSTYSSSKTYLTPAGVAAQISSNSETVTTEYSGTGGTLAAKDTYTSTTTGATTVQVWDNGVRHRVTTSTWTAGTGTTPGTQTDSTVTTEKQPERTMNLGQLSLAVGVAFRF